MFYVSNISESLSTNLKQFETTEVKSDKMDQVRENLKVKLAECSASALFDIKPKAKTKVEFKIQLINLRQRPLESKARKLPFHMQDKVQKQIDEQLESGMIRKSTSEWTSPLRCVHKPDGEIRITIDYKPLNKVIKSDNIPLPNTANIYKK